MESAIGFVVVAVELAARMENGQHGFQRAFFGLGMFVDWDPATVVADGDRFAILVQLQCDFGLQLQSLKMKPVLVDRPADGDSTH